MLAPHTQTVKICQEPFQRLIVCTATVLNAQCSICGETLISRGSGSMTVYFKVSVFVISTSVSQLQTKVLDRSFEADKLVQLTNTYPTLSLVNFEVCWKSSQIRSSALAVVMWQYLYNLSLLIGDLLTRWHRLTWHRNSNHTLSAVF